MFVTRKQSTTFQPYCIKYPNPTLHVQSQWQALLSQLDSKFHKWLLAVDFRSNKGLLHDVQQVWRPG